MVFIVFKLEELIDRAACEKEPQAARDLPNTSLFHMLKIKGP